MLLLLLVASVLSATGPPLPMLPSTLPLLLLLPLPPLLLLPFK
jgi:hypothetical protein